MEQSHRQKTNINQIMNKYMRTGTMPTCMAPGYYGDFTQSGDFHECKNRVLDAQEKFEQLPADLRKKFENDPGKFIDFVENTDNALELLEMGIKRDGVDYEALARNRAQSEEGAGQDPGQEAGQENPNNQ